MITRGEHPVTKAKLGPPITQHQHNSNDLPIGTANDKIPPCIDNDGTAFSDAFRRRGIPAAASVTGTTVHLRTKAK